MPLGLVWPGNYAMDLHSWLAKEMETGAEKDLVIICLGGKLMASQARVAPLSPFLYSLIQSQVCCGCGGRKCSKRGTITLQVNVERQVMLQVLWLCHTGKVMCKTSKEVEAVKEALKMLGININLELETTSQGSTVPSSKMAQCFEKSSPKRKSEEKQENSKKRRRVEASSPKDPVAQQVEMAKELTSVTRYCNMPGCDEEVSLANMTNHFKKHVVEQGSKVVSSKSAGSLVLFKCSKCDKAFKLRKARDQHGRSCEKEQVPNTKSVIQRSASLDLNKEISDEKCPDADFFPSSPTEELLNSTEMDILAVHSDNEVEQGNSEVKNKSPDKEEAIIQKENTGPDLSNLTRKCVVNLSPSAKIDKLPEKQDVTPRKGKILECPSCKKQYKSMGVGLRSYIEHVKVCTTQSDKMKTHAKGEETDMKPEEKKTLVTDGTNNEDKDGQASNLDDTTKESPEHLNAAATTGSTPKQLELPAQQKKRLECPHCQKQYKTAGSGLHYLNEHIKVCGKKIQVGETELDRLKDIETEADNSEKGSKLLSQENALPRPSVPKHVRQCKLCSKKIPGNNLNYARHVRYCKLAMMKNSKQKTAIAKAKLCPSCRQRFLCHKPLLQLKFQKHVKLCSNSLKSGKTSDKKEECPHCQKVFPLDSNIRVFNFQKHLQRCSSRQNQNASATNVGTQQSKDSGSSKLVKMVADESQMEQEAESAGEIRGEEKENMDKTTSGEKPPSRKGGEKKNCPTCEKQYIMLGKGVMYFEEHIRACKLDKDKDKSKKVSKMEHTQYLQPEAPTTREYAMKNVSIRLTKLQLDMKSVKVKKPEKTKEHSDASMEMTKKRDGSACQLCSEEFQRFSDLRNHYTTTHYWSRLKSKFSCWGDRCYFCLVQFSCQENLLRHMGNFHCSKSIDQFLLEDGFKVTTVEWTCKLTSTLCLLCPDQKDWKTSAALKAHLATSHYSSQIKREFYEFGQAKKKKCPKCSKICATSSFRTQHIGSFHDEVMKYARRRINVAPADANIIPVNGFKERGKPIKVDVEDIKAALLLLQKTRTEEEDKNSNPCQSKSEPQEDEEERSVQLARSLLEEDKRREEERRRKTLREKEHRKKQNSSEKGKGMSLGTDKKEPPSKQDALVKEEYGEFVPEEKMKCEYFESPSLVEESASSEETHPFFREIVQEVEDIIDKCIDAIFQPVSRENCFICDENLLPCDVLKHLSNHFIVELDKKYANNQTTEEGLLWCSECQKMFEDKFDFLDHMGILHGGLEEFIPLQYRHYFAKSEVFQQKSKVVQLDDWFPSSDKESEDGNQSLEIQSNEALDMDVGNICDEEETEACKDKCDKDNVANYELDKNMSDKPKDLVDFKIWGNADQDDKSDKRGGGNERNEERSDVHLEHSKSISGPRKEEATGRTLETDEMQIHYEENLQMENTVQTDIRALFDSDSDSESDPE